MGLSSFSAKDPLAGERPSIFIIWSCVEISNTIENNIFRIPFVLMVDFIKHSNLGLKKQIMFYG